MGAAKEVAEIMRLVSLLLLLWWEHMIKAIFKRNWRYNSEVKWLADEMNALNETSLQLQRVMIPCHYLNSQSVQSNGPMRSCLARGIIFSS
ncbi:hypothetical protein RND71_008558 [Anisodus tanguticus]|uniref:Uncharacterized protein n=1 Tax=Anisodus tanguticus TaxID=243964 RepID=A0AAE1SNY3_9SOLA|nr:hypothetical protein RND71_008558 [Anisodus tanguticus]